MSKQLFGLFNPRGKTPEELHQAMVSAYQKFQETGKVTVDIAEPQSEWEKNIERRAKRLGLKRCDQCGEYKSSETAKRRVVCNCSNIPCPRCAVNKIRRPISNYFSQDDGKIWHVPYFSNSCRDCRRR